MKEDKRKMLMEKREAMLAYERAYRAKGYRLIGGTDEAGRGPLAGPVVAACVVLPDMVTVLGIDDSKKLSEKKRETLFSLILDEATAVGIGQADNTTIDTVNILQATKLAMEEAVRAVEIDLRRKGLPPMDFLITDAVSLTDIGIPQMALIKGDQKSISIAAASIIAKVTRDRIMKAYDKEYPGYGFASHKGYGTKAHYQQIKERGLTPIHRKTFLVNLSEH